MTDTVTESVATAEEAGTALEAPAVEQKLIEQLVGQARAKGLQLTGEGGLLQQLTKRVLESALEGEITDHLGYDKHDAAGKNGGNSRNGTRSKTVVSDVGPVELEVPRDREGSFEPQLVHKRQRRLTGVDEMVLSLSAKGLTHGEICAHLAEVYGASVSKTTITTITDSDSGIRAPVVVALSLTDALLGCLCLGLSGRRGLLQAPTGWIMTS